MLKIHLYDIKFALISKVTFLKPLFSATSYYVSNAKTNIDGISCKLATPPLRYTKEGVFVKGISSDIQRSSPLWIGYTEKYVSFQYYGKIVKKKK